MEQLKLQREIMDLSFKLEVQKTEAYLRATKLLNAISDEIFDNKLNIDNKTRLLLFQKVAALTNQIIINKNAPQN